MKGLIYIEALRNLYHGYRTAMILLKGFIPRNYDKDFFNHHICRYYSVPRGGALKFINFLRQNSIKFKILIKDNIDVDWLRRFKFPTDCVITEDEFDNTELNNIDFVIKSDDAFKYIVLIKNGEIKAKNFYEIISLFPKSISETF